VNPRRGNGIRGVPLLSTQTHILNEKWNFSCTLAFVHRKFLGECCDRLRRFEPQSVHTAQRHRHTSTPGTVVRVSYNSGLRQCDRGNEWPTKRDAQRNWSDGDCVLRYCDRLSFCCNRIVVPGYDSGRAARAVHCDVYTFRNWRGIRQRIVCQQCVEFSDRRRFHRHWNPSPAAQRQSLLDREHIDEHHRLQRLSWV